MSVINLSWDADGIIDSYNIYRSESAFDQNSLPVALATGVTSKEYSDAAILPNKTYYYMISSKKAGIEKFSELVGVQSRVVVYQDINWYAPVTPAEFLSDFAITDSGKRYTLNPPRSGGYYKASSNEVRNATNGKYYAELKVLRSTGNFNGDTAIGVAKSNVDHVRNTSGTLNPGTGGRYQFRVQSGYIQVSGNDGTTPSWVNLTPGGFALNDIIGLSIEDDSGSTIVKLYKNGSLLGNISTIPSLIDLRIHITRWLSSSNHVFELLYPSEILYPQPGFQAW